MFEPADILDRLGGIARGVLLQEYGCTRHQLAAAAASGSIDRLRPGVYAIRTVDPRIIVAAEHGGALTCTDALRAHGIWVLPARAENPHVWLGGSGRRHDHAGCSCVTHSSPGTAAVGVAPVVHALIHSYRCLEPEEFFAAYESAWQQRLLSTHDRARIRRELPRRARWLLDLARADSGSGLESLLRFRLHLLGLTLECQVAIPGVGRVDFVLGGTLILEVDGRENHDGEALRHKDLMRDAAASALGYETLRFDYAMVVHAWDVVVAAIRAGLTRTLV